METSNLTKKRIADYLAEEKRFDNRALLDFRKIEIETGISENAEGSARVKFGNTEVVAGVKLDVAEPYTDHEDEGTLITSVEMLPMSSSRYEPGPPKIDAIELARIVDRGIRESGFIDFKKLCIKKAEKVWAVYIDFYSINDDGNLIDAAALAAVAALLTARMPKLDGDKVKYGEWTKEKIPLSKLIPLTITLHKVGEKIIVDPNTEEEDSADVRLTISMSEGKKELMINAMQKGKEGALEIKEINEMINIAEKKFKELEKKIEEVKR